MKKTTEDNLKNAFAGESQAHMKYLNFASKAESENLPHIARLFRANSFAEQIHASNHLKALSGVSRTADNLREAIEGETFEVEKMYPEYIRIAEEDEEPQAVFTTKAALAAEKVHQSLYRKAREAAVKGVDAELGPIHVCGVCGFTVEGEAPDKCPVCGAPRDKFVKF